MRNEGEGNALRPTEAAAEPRDAWVIVVAGHQGALLARARRRGLATADALDVCQETWLALVERGPRPEESCEHLRAWLLEVVQNKIVDRRRRQSRHGAIDVDQLRGSDQEPAAPAADTAAAEERERRLARVREALDRLRGGRQHLNVLLLEMRCLKGMSLREIAAAVDQTPAQVKDRLRRARGRAAGAGDGPGAAAPARGQEGERRNLRIFSIFAPTSAGLGRLYR